MMVRCCWAQGYHEPLSCVSNMATAAAACRFYEKRFSIEIVYTHMTQGGGVPWGSRRHPRTDVHLRLLDDDAINASCHPLSALGNRPRGEGRVHAVAQRLDALGSGRNVHGRRRLGIAWPQWLRYPRVGLGPLLSFPLALRPCDPLCAGQIAQPSWLAFALRQDVTPRLPSCVEGLGHPFPQLRPCPCLGDEGRLPPHAAEVLPDPVVSGVCGRIARRAAGAPGCPQRSWAPLTAVRVLARGKRPPGTRPPPRPTADEAPQSVGVRRRVTTCPRPSALQAALGGCKGRGAHEGRHRHGHPCLQWRGLLPWAGADRRHSGCAPARWSWTAPAPLRPPWRSG
jgi:hypothetical protein